MKYNHWTKDMKISIELFPKLIPKIQPWFGVGEFIRHEGKKDEKSKELDLLWGVDYSYKDENGTIGIASRIQKQKDWGTWTIREERHTGAKTELEKRKESIKNGDRYPEITFQAYFTPDKEFLSVASCFTKDLYEFIEKYPELVGRRKSDNWFRYVNWIDFKLKGYPVKIIRAGGVQDSGRLI